MGKVPVTRKTVGWTPTSKALQLSQGRYGAPRLTLDPRAEGWRASRRRVAKRLRMLGLRAKAARNFQGHHPVEAWLKHPRPQTGWNRTSPPPRQTGVAGGYYLRPEPTRAGLYLAVVLDVYSRAVVGLGMAGG